MRLLKGTVGGGHCRVVVLAGDARRRGSRSLDLQLTHKVRFYFYLLLMCIMQYIAGRRSF